MFRLSAFLIALAFPSPTLAEVCLSADGWEPLDFEDIKPNSFDVSDNGDLGITGDNSASFMIQPLMIDIGQTPVLTWRWRVDAVGEPSDLTRKGGDDRPVAIYVAFPYDPENASFGERMRRKLVESSQGADAPGKLIAYIWGGTQPAGTRYQNPYTGTESQFVIVERGDAPTGEWRQVQINLTEDYQSLFGRQVNKVQYVAVFSDSDDTQSRVEAQITDICFSARAG